MGLKYHTIIVVPHSRARFRKWRVSNRQLKLAVATVAVLTLAAGFLTWSWFDTSVNHGELARLRTENEQLRTINDSFEGSVRDLQQQLSSYEDRTAELAIVAGLEEVPSTAGRVAGSNSGAGGTEDVSATRFDLDLFAERADQLDEQLDLVSSKLEERSLYISRTPAIMPVRGVFTSRYGYRRDPITSKRAYHQGVDISAQKGRPVFATADGVVTKAGRNGSLGRAVYLSHGFGLSTRYGHLDKLNVAPGQKVQRGDVIGFVGNSGRSTGYHLHYEVRADNKALDPMGYILDLPRAKRRG